MNWTCESGTDEITLQMVIAYLEANRLLIYIQVTVLTLLTVHLVTTFNREVECIWKAKQSYMTVIYYVIRYFPLISTIFALAVNTNFHVKYMENMCQMFWWIDAMGSSTITVLTEVMMITRIWALYSFSNRVLVFLGTIFLGGMGLSSWSGITFVAAIRPLPWPQDAPRVPGCPNIIPSTPYSIPIVLAFHMLSTGTIFICTLRQCVTRNSRDQPYLGTWRDLVGIRTAWPLVHILIRDGCLYFLIVFFTALILLIMTSISQSFAFCAIHIAQVGLSIPATTLLLNLRHRSSNEGRLGGLRPDDLALPAVSDFQFARRSAIVNARILLTESQDLSLNNQFEYEMDWRHVSDGP